jgi:hypothetical protein
MNETEGSIEERLTQMYALAADVLGLDPEYVASPMTVAAIRVYLKLYSLNEGDFQKIRAWLKTDHEELGGAPSEHVHNEEGLNRILKLLNK